MLLTEIAKALRQAFEARQRNAEGDYRPDPMAERFPAEFVGASGGGGQRSSSTSPRYLLMGLVEDWWREARLRECRSAPMRAIETQRGSSEGS